MNFIKDILVGMVFGFLCGLMSIALGFLFLICFPLGYFVTGITLLMLIILLR